MDINNLLTRSLGNLFSGLGITILGNPSGKYNFNFDWTPLNVRSVWVDTSYNELMSVAQNVPHLNVAISRSAEMFGQMRIKHVDKNNEDVENSQVLEFMKKPDVLSAQSQWLYDYYIYKCVYNNQFIYPLRAMPSTMPVCLKMLPSGLIKVNLTGKVYRQWKLEQIIESWEMLGDDVPFKPNEIIHISTGLTMNGIIKASPITSLQIPLSNIMASLKSENIILAERGMIGFLRTDSKDDAGPMPMSRQAKKIVEETYQSNRSLDSRSSHVGMFSGKTEWVPMTFDIQQLGLREGNEEHFCTILAAYGIPREIFPSAKGATFENQNEARKSFITDTLQPAGQTLLERLTADVFAPFMGQGEKLIPDFSYMPIMQENKVEEGQAYFSLIEANDILFRSGIIDAKTYAQEADVEMTGPGKPLLAPTPKPVPANAPGPIPPPKA
jgi:phage portal protein BeeE